MADIKKPAGFRVLIAGGGIAGLTLANALQHAGVDYLLLEARSEIAPQVGASIGVAPSGNRILDQLSCYDDIEKVSEPVEFVGNHDAGGNDLAPRSDMFRLGQARTNYPVCFLDRQIVLRVLAEHISDQDKMLLNKRVDKVVHSIEGLTVYCTDGSAYWGDIIAGADGVSSKVRREMWQAADAAEPGVISKEEQCSMTAEYKCLFGISAPVSGLKVRDFEVTYTKDVSSMVIIGKGARVFWFLFGRLPHICRSNEIPQFSQSDLEHFAQQNLDLPILPHGTVRFRDIWENKERCNLVAVEEADYINWTWGRFVCLGDSIHKMTPNSGAGGNAAIESAAALANAVYSLVNKSNRHVDLADVRQALTGYQQSHKVRTSEIFNSAHDLTRIHALKGTKERMIVQYLLPVAGDLFADRATDSWIGSSMLNFLPPPTRSLLGTMPFNASQGLGKHESTLRRALIALPLLMMGLWCFRILLPLLPYTHFLEIFESGTLSWGEHSSIPVLQKFFHVKILDIIIQRAALVLVPSALGFDPPSSHQMFTFLADSGLVYSIMLIEGARRANIFTPACLPFIFGMLSTHGIGVFFPIYYFLHYTLNPISTFAAADKRLTDRAYTFSVLPIMALAYYVPLLLAYCAQDLNLRYKAVWVWHLFPLWVTIGQHILAWTVTPNTIKVDRLHNVRRDLWTIRITIGTLVAVSTGIWLHTLYSVSASSFTLYTMFVPQNESVHTYISSIRNLLIWDQVFFAGSSILWIVYLFADMKRAGMVKQSWGMILTLLMIASLAGGTGTATTVGWLWREEVLATTRHKDAVIKGWEEKGKVPTNKKS